MHCEVYLRRNISCLQCKIAKSRSWHKTYMHNALMRYGKELKNGKRRKAFKKDLYDTSFWRVVCSTRRSCFLLRKILSKCPSKHVIGYIYIYIG